MVNEKQKNFISKRKSLSAKEKLVDLLDAFSERIKAAKKVKANIKTEFRENKREYKRSLKAKKLDSK